MIIDSTGSEADQLAYNLKGHQVRMDVPGQQEW